jgi:hypothetical protein
VRGVPPVEQSEAADHNGESSTYRPAREARQRSRQKLAPSIYPSKCRYLYREFESLPLRQAFIRRRMNFRRHRRGSPSRADLTQRKLSLTVSYGLR